MEKQRYNPNNLHELLPKLAQAVSKGVLNRATQHGQFEIPVTGPGKHSLLNALRKLQGPFTYSK